MMFSGPRRLLHEYERRGYGYRCRDVATPERLTITGTPPNPETYQPDGDADCARRAALARAMYQP